MKIASGSGEIGVVSAEGKNNGNGSLTVDAETKFVVMEDFPKACISSTTVKCLTVSPTDL